VSAVLVLLDERTWTSGDDTAKFVEHIHTAMRIGLHLTCVHEFPSVVGPPRHECEFALMFNDDWTPAHLTGGSTNLYKEIALALKSVEWRQPGFVAFASKLAASSREHKPIDVKVPSSYEPKTGPNLWQDPALQETQPWSPAHVVPQEATADATQTPAPPLVAAEEVTERGTLKLEMQAIKSNTAKTDPTAELGVAQDLSNRLKSIFAPSTTLSTAADMDLSDESRPDALAAARDRADLSA